VPAINAATITAFYLFDVAEQIDLPSVRSAVGDAATAARLTGGRGAPSYLQYARPPVVVDSDALGFGAFDGFKGRIKFFDYGVLSLGLSRPFAGEWSDLVAASQRYIENDTLEEKAEACCRSLMARFPSAMRGVRGKFLAEDYLVLAVTSLERSLTADELIASRGREIAQILRGELQILSTQEQEDILRNRLSYLPDDLVIPTWNASFIYDTEAGAHAALEIVEFANSQLLEFRYYDELLDVELGRIYAQLQQPHWWDTLSGRGYIRAAHQLNALFIDVNEITDQTQNALKMVGDIYAAKLFHLTASRLGLEPWKASVAEKLTTLNEIYRFAVEQVAISRGQFLELTIIAILILELVLFFMGIMT
jgi:hypothetical protein